MPEQTRIWTIDSEDTLQEIKSSRLDQESRIQTWVEQDIDIISSNLLVIGREVETDYNGYIDILCLDRQGDVVVVELKRDKTPREVTAQALDYASWVKDLSHNDITELAERYLKPGTKLEEVFLDKFGETLPEILNNNHRMLIIGSRIDSSTERIINYLSESYGVGINAITFTFYEHDGKEFLSRNTLIEEDEAAAQQARHSRSKRKPPLTIEEFRSSIKDEALLGIFDHAVSAFVGIFDGRNTTQSTVSFVGNMDGSKNTILAIEPLQSDPGQGLSFYFYFDRFLTYFNLNEDKLHILFDNNLTKDKLSNVDDGLRRGKLTSKEMVDSIINTLRSSK